MLFSWLNPTRLRVYPRLIAGTMGAVLLFNGVCGNGWKGVTGQIIGADFIAFFTSGVIFHQNPNLLYDFDVQAQTQQALTAPTRLWGFMPFINPPYVAEVMSLFTAFPMAVAFISWICFSLIAAVLSAQLIAKNLLPKELTKTYLPVKQLVIVIISSFAFMEGLHMGQNHGLTLLLITAAIVCDLRKQWLIAGIMAGLLLYKPHFALGLLIVWLVWKHWSALIGFGSVAVLWIGGFLLRNDWYLFKEYLSNGTLLLKSEYIQGFSGKLGVTPYSLLIDLLPVQSWSGIIIFIQVVLFICSIGLAFYAFKYRNVPENERNYPYILAILYPLLVSPHVLLHDLVILVPALALWAQLWQDRKFLNLVIAIYAGTFVLPLAAKLLGISVLAVIPTGLAAILLYQLAHHPVTKQTELIV